MKFKFIPIFIILLSLVACKPPKFNQNIVCETYTATNVHVYTYDPTRIVIIHPDYTYQIIFNEKCTVTGIK